MYCRYPFICQLTISIFFLLFLNIEVRAQNLEKLKSNLISHYNNEGSSEKIKAVNFLISNIQYHKSIKCVWSNKDRTKNSYDEFDFENYLLAKEVLEKAKKEKVIYSKLIIILDKDQISSEYLIKNIDAAFKSWKENPWSKHYSFEIFCEYILPYKSLVEPIERNWRDDSQLYHAKAITNLLDKNDPVELCTNIIHEMKYFTFVPSRIDPQPLLSLSQLRFRREGNCPDLANYAILANRALGVATTMDFTPHFAASSNRHFWNTVVDATGEHIPFNANQGDPYTYDANYRRMGKVLRRTFSRQDSSIAAKIPLKDIPGNFFRDVNIKDVTKEYVDVSDIEYQFKKPSQNRINYITVFNKNKWRLLWWGESDENQITTFNQMGRNIVYLPAQVIESSGKKNIKLAPYPLLLNKEGKSKELKPNYTSTYSGELSKKDQITANNKDYNTLEFEERKSLNLFYWDNGWQLQGKYTVEDEKIQIKEVPRNSLLLLTPEEPDGFERIFILKEKESTFQMTVF